MYILAQKAYQCLEKGRISAIQLSFLIITYVISTADVFLPAYVYQESKQDSWISVIIGTLASLFFVFIFLNLGLKFPDKTLIQYSCDVLGKPLGKAVGFIYIYYFIIHAKAVTRQLSEILVTAFNSAAPISAYGLITLLVALYAVSQGLEVIARVNQVLLPFGLFLILFVAFVNISEMDLKNFLPILSEGIMPPIRGAFLIMSWLLESSFVLQVIPFVREKDKVRKYALVSIIILSIGLMFGVSIVAVFGPLTGKLLFPALEFVRYGRLGRFIQNLDITIMGFWITGIFVKIAISIYVIFTGVVQLLELKDGKRLLLPVSLMVFGMSVSSPRMQELYHIMHYIYPFTTALSAILIPFLLLVVASLRKQGRRAAK